MRGNCSREIYVKYFLGEPLRTTCTGLSDILEDVSHDSVNRFLLTKNYRPHDLFDQVRAKINLQGGVLSVDDTVIDKPYSDPYKTELIGYYWSGKHHRSVKGINVVTLYYTDPFDVCVPINYRLYNPKDGKTKNDYFQDMMAEVLEWGLIPAWVTGDCWYSSLDNLKFVRKHGLGMLFGIEKNRQISLAKGSFIAVENIQDWQENGHVVYLKDFGMVRVLRQVFKDTYRYYMMAMPKIEMLDDLTLRTFKRIHDAHWNIERFHRAAKQLCNLETFQLRKTKAITNHIFCSMIAFTNLEFMRIKGNIHNWYQLQRDALKEAISHFIRTYEFKIL